MQSNPIAEVILPGFRFHPTDEELVGFYLHSKVQHKSLPFDVITQLDIYKFDPWDLPKLAVSGENVWYFFCLRDQKYRNSTRPNRVTKGGFWKATGPDRPIYTAEGGNCIGLKKSLVFYKGKAAKGTKTDWVMHEFRLPVISTVSSDPKRHSKVFEESWAVCRIFKKRSSARRVVSDMWASPIPEASSLSLLTNDLDAQSNEDSSFTPTEEIASPLGKFQSNISITDVSKQSRDYDGFFKSKAPSSPTLSSKDFLNSNSSDEGSPLSVQHPPPSWDLFALVDMASHSTSPTSL